MNKYLLSFLLIALASCSRQEAGLREYHEALTLMEQGDAPSALKQLERAQELATTDSLLALTHSQMGTLYFSQRLLSDNSQQPLSDEVFHQLEDAIEQADPGFTRRLQEFCRLTPQERRVCWLIRLGITPIGIAQLTAHSKQSVSNTRSRLYEKAFGQKGTPAQWDEFVLSV